jgi:hypothetical protein
MNGIQLAERPSIIGRLGISGQQLFDQCHQEFTDTTSIRVDKSLKYTESGAQKLVSDRPRIF